MISGWQEVLKEMTKDFIVYYLETREKISSQIKGKVDYSVEEIGNDIIQLIKMLKLHNRKYILVGSSLGATSILNCCKELHVQPLSLILIGPNAEFRIPFWGILVIKLFYPPLYNFIKPYLKWYLKTFRLDIKHDYEQYEKYSSVLDFADPRKLKQAALSVYKYSVWNLLDKIEYPTLILGGSKDKLHEPENLKRIVSQMKKAAYVDMKTNKGTHSKEVVDEIRKYLANL
jgi:pimeloyl-ACP methyl ester carboxylesterase